MTETHGGVTLPLGSVTATANYGFTFCLSETLSKGGRVPGLPTKHPEDQEESGVWPEKQRLGMHCEGRRKGRGEERHEEDVLT